MARVRGWLLTLLLLPACLVLTACSDPDEGLSVLERGLSSDPETLDPQRARSVQAADVLRDTGEGLLGYTADGQLVAAAAAGWEVSEDGLAYRFTLREDARWSNGEALVAAHFVAGLQRLVDPAIAAFYADTVADIENARDIIAGAAPVASLGVTALDDRLLEIRLSRPVPYLLSLLTHPSTFPYNGEHSNGAYRLVRWDPGSLLRLERNEFYRDSAAVAIDVVKHHVITEETAELNRFRSGELHTTSTVPPESFSQTRQQFGDQLRIAPYLGIYYYGFNLTRPPFRDQPELRQALSMAIDREVLVERVTGRGEAPAYSWVPPGTDNYEPPRLSYADISQAERNAIARSLYAQAGYGADNPLAVELRYNSSATQQRIALAVQSMWRETLGIEATLVAEEFQVLLANIRQQQVTQIFRGSWIGDYNDATTFLNLLRGDNPANVSGYSSDAYDTLLRRASAQTDPGRRRLYLEEAERVLLADHAAIPLYFYVSKHLVSDEVRGWQDNVLDYHYSQHLSLDTVTDD